MKFTVVIALLVCCFANVNSQISCRGSLSFFARFICSRTTTTTTTTTPAPTTSSPQSTGHMLGQLFVENFMKPAAGSGQSGSGLSGRNLVIPSNKKPEPLTCFGGFLDDNGNVIAGNCNQQGFGRRNNRKKRCPITQTKRDLLIMLDESGSVGRTRFEKVKRIAAAIVRLLCDQIKVTSHLTRVAVMSFDRQVHSHIELNGVNRNDGEALANSIMNIRYSSRSHGRTCMKTALEFARNDALVTGGRRGQPDVEQDIIIITDGCANCNQNQSPLDVIREQTQMFINAGIHVYVIGISLGNSCRPVLQELAQGGRCYHFFYLNNWTYIVDDFLDSLENPPNNVCLDIFESPTGQCLPPI